jgi:hypothetical protein
MSNLGLWITVAGLAAQIVHAATGGAGFGDAAAQGAAVPLPRGIYLYREQLTNDPQYEQALGVPGVDGMAVVLDWSSLQPARDAFETDTIDSQLKVAKAHHLPVELVVRAGRSVPDWVAPNAQLKLAYSNHGGQGACLAVTMPPPWNPNFQNAFKALLKRTSDYIRGQGVTLAVVKLTGINATSEELRLPAEAPDATKDCAGGAIDDVAVWKNAGYTPSKVVRAMTELAGAFGEIFPGTPVALPMIPGGGFPPINESGRIVRGQDMRTENVQLLASLVQAAGGPLAGRLILQHDFLGYDQPANPEVVGLAVKNDLHVAWQTNLWRGNLKEGAGCGGAALKATPCTNDQYLNLLRSGIHPAGGKGPSAKGLFIEVFPFDAIAHRGPIQKAHDELKNGS